MDESHSESDLLGGVMCLSKNKSRWKIDGAVAMCMGIWTLSQVTSIEDTFW